MQIELSEVKVDIPSTGRELFTVNRLVLASAEKVLIHGASGRGKTTLLHLMAGLHLPRAGNVTLGTHRLDQLSDEMRALLRRRHIGFIFQKLNLVDYLTCEENVRLGLCGPYNQQLIADALGKVGMSGRAKELCVKLSLGEQQRVAIARVLAAKPAVILADEPTSSLDAANANAVMDALFDASSSGSTLVVVSHDERLRPRFDRVIDFEKLVKL